MVLNLIKNVLEAIRDRRVEIYISAAIAAINLVLPGVRGLFAAVGTINLVLPGVGHLSASFPGIVLGVLSRRHEASEECGPLVGLGLLPRLSSELPPIALDLGEPIFGLLKAIRLPSPLSLGLLYCKTLRLLSSAISLNSISVHSKLIKVKHLWKRAGRHGKAGDCRLRVKLQAFPAISIFILAAISAVVINVLVISAAAAASFVLIVIVILSLLELAGVF